MKKKNRLTFIFCNVLFLITLTGCGGNGGSKNAKESKITNKAVSTFSLNPGEYIADTDSSSVFWECGWIGGYSHNGDVSLEQGLLSVNYEKGLTGSFLVDMTTIDCFDEKNLGTKNKIIGHLMSDDFFDVENHQKASLVITSSENIGGNMFSFEGNLTIKNITNSVQMKGEVQKTDLGYSAVIDLIFDRSKYDVKYRSASFFSDLGDRTISDDVSLNVKVKMNKKT